MNKTSTCRWLVPFVVQALLAGCSALAVSSEVLDAESEDEFWRTTYCVAGGLPMEVRFSLADNPVKLEGDSFDLKNIDQIIEQVDIKIAALLKDSVTAAWQQIHDKQLTQWSNEFINELVDVLIAEISARAPKSLGIGFCGSREQVGSAAYTAIFGYFSRAVQLDDAQWLTHARARSNAGIIVMLAVSLHLAQIDFDTGKLTQAISE